MAIFETYSKRQKKKSNQEIKDIYIYDKLSETFKVQVVHIWKDAIGTNEDIWKKINLILAREYGLFELSEGRQGNFGKCMKFLMNGDISQSLDIIELTFKIIDKVIRNYSYYEKDIEQINQNADDAIIELNHRFKEHCIGYEFVSGQLIRIDNRFIHNEVIVPTMNLLYEANFIGANDEFLKAHKHFRNKDYKEAINESLKAFESTMKNICSDKKYIYDSDKDTASRLIKILFDNDFIPLYLQNHFSGLRNTLESGLPTVRNKVGGHGQGVEQIVIPEYFAAYCLNLCATNIKFLVDLYLHKD